MIGGKEIFKGVTYWAPSGNSGYSNAAKDYILGLNDLGVTLSYKYFVFDNTGTKDTLTKRGKMLESLVNKKISDNVVLIHSTPEHWPGVIKENPGKKIIGMTVWETDKLHPDWIKWLNMVDMVIVPCEWNKKVFKECGVKSRIEVIPHILKPGKNVNSEIHGINENDYIFYTIGQESNRKGILDTIKSYLNEFNGDEDVVLVVKSFGSNFSRNEQLILKKKITNIVERYNNPAKIILILDELSEQEMDALHTKGECYVSLCKSEGWGLGAFDAAGRNKKVIMTGYGGQLDFLTKCKNSKLVDYELIPVMGMEWIPWYKTEQRWALPDTSHASKLMREAYEERDGEIVDDKLLKHFNSQKVSKQLFKLISEPHNKGFHFNRPNRVKR
jgi:hypothetical protein